MQNFDIASLFSDERPPALSGQKYGILVTDALSVDGLAQSISQLINEYDENIGGWETFASTSANQSITVTINGTTLTIPGIGKLAQKGSNGALAIADGGTGATKAEDARSNLGLGSSAVRNVRTGSNDVVTVESSGIGGLSRTGDNNVNSFTDRTCFFTAGNNGPTNGVVFGLNVVHGGLPASYASQLVFRNGRSYLRSLEAGTSTPWYENYSQANTTKSSDGTLKAASPVVRIVSSREKNQRADLAEDGFTWCGCGTSNAEAEGINISRLDTGVYVLTGSAGLASEGWQLLPPMDPAGMGELGIVEAEQTESGGLTIRLFRRKYMLTESGEMVKTKGEPIDVPANSWIDIRLDMPEDSIWNKRIAEASQKQNVNTENHET